MRSSPLATLSKNLKKHCTTRYCNSPEKLKQQHSASAYLSLSGLNSGQLPAIPRYSKREPSPTASCRGCSASAAHSNSLRPENHGTRALEHCSPASFAITEQKLAPTVPWGCRTPRSASTANKTHFIRKMRIPQLTNCATAPKGDDEVWYSKLRIDVTLGPVAVCREGTMREGRLPEKKHWSMLGPKPRHVASFHSVPSHVSFHLLHPTSGTLFNFTTT